MVVLSRKRRESVVVSGHDPLEQLLKVTVPEIRPGEVKLALEAGIDVAVGSTGGLAANGRRSARGAGGKAMTGIEVDVAVQLTRDFPELGLRCGEMGLVCSIWFAPIAAYEVEFERKPPDCGVRALVMPSQIQVTEEEGDGRIAPGRGRRRRC